MIRESFAPLSTSGGGSLSPDTVTTCTTESQCSANGSKKKCYGGRCVECHRNNQCVDPDKLRCNLQTFTCENGHYLGAYLTRKLGAEAITGNMDNVENHILEMNLGTIPDLYANMR